MQSDEKDNEVKMKLPRLRSVLIAIAFAILFYAAVMNIDKVMAGVSVFFSFLSPVIVGLAAAYIMNVVMTLLETKIFRFMTNSKRPAVRKAVRPICLILTLVIVAGVVTLLLFAVLPNLKDTFLELFQKIPGYIDTFRNWLVRVLNGIEFLDIDTTWLENINIEWTSAIRFAQNLDWEVVLGWFNLTSDTIVSEAATSAASTAATAATAAVSVVRGLVSFIFSFIIAIYFLAEKEKICGFCRRVCTAFLPDKVSKGLFHVIEVANRNFSGFIHAQFTEALVFGLLTFIFMSIFQFRYAGITATVIGITTLVPIIGPTIGLVFGAFLQLTVSPLRAILLIVMVLVQQQIDDNLIYPRIVGEIIGLPAILVLSAVLVGTSVGGIPGAFLGVPLCAVLYDLLREAITARNAKKKAEHEALEAAAAAADGGGDAPPEEPPAGPGEENAEDAEASGTENDTKKE